MSKKSLNMELGNLVCRFGDKKVLLDLINEIVLPAFLDTELERSFDKTKYFFYNVSVVMLDDKKGTIGIVGRIIKDTTLEREQIYKKDKGLIQDSGAMQSSPSSLFLLILNNHRLVYVKETKDAPSKETFRTTLLDFLKVKHKAYIQSVYEERNAAAENDPKLGKTTKKELFEEFPRPTLELIPLTSEENIESFVKKYSTLKTIQISLSDRNDETDNDPFFEQFQNKKDAIGSTNSTVTHNNRNGLDKDEAIKEIAEATAQGNQEVKLVGEDTEGDTLRGNNEEFQLRKPIANISKNPEHAAVQLFQSFSTLVKDGIVRVPNVTQKTKSIIEQLVNNLF